MSASPRLSGQGGTLCLSLLLIVHLSTILRHVSAYRYLLDIRRTNACRRVSRACTFTIALFPSRRPPLRSVDDRCITIPLRSILAPRGASPSFALPIVHRHVGPLCHIDPRRESNYRHLSRLTTRLLRPPRLSREYILLSSDQQSVSNFTPPFYISLLGH